MVELFSIVTMASSLSTLKDLIMEEASNFLKGELVEATLASMETPHLAKLERERDFHDYTSNVLDRHLIKKNIMREIQWYPQSKKQIEYHIHLSTDHMVPTIHF